MLVKVRGVNIPEINVPIVWTLKQKRPKMSIVWKWFTSQYSETRLVRNSAGNPTQTYTLITENSLLDSYYS